MRTTGRMVMVAMVALGVMHATAYAQTGRSAAIADSLASLLDARAVDAVAARDPDAPDRFVAALYFRGSQLLVVSARYPVPVLLEARLQRGEFRELYTDLQATATAEGRLFVHDMQANGLRPACDPGQPFDVIYEAGVRQTTFNGDWAGQGLTEAEYRQRFATADERYAHMLAALIAALKSPT